jgi:hypothetical protein
MSADVGSVNASYDAWNKIERENSDYFKTLFKDIFVNYYADSILLNQKNGMTYKDYKALFKRAKDMGKKIDVLAVDGLSMMGGQGNEKDRVDENTLMMKELAKEEDVFVPLIVHATRGETKHCRDLFSKARGSEKIIDNVDLAFTCSLIQKNESEYERDSGYIRLWNKRDSGNTVNVVYDFFANKLKMSESSRDPLEVELKQENTKSFF